jgi:thiopurine S-methyltransferase
MNPDFWHSRWKESRTGFHRETANPALEHWDAPEGAHVLVPLCGKSVDLHWLAERGHRVTGVELSPLACEQFFAEAGLSPQKDQLGPFVRWSSGPYTLLQGDVFALTGTFDAVYDRAALVALPPEMRQRYAEVIRRVVKGTGLLVTFEYPQQEYGGPPFSVPEEEVMRHFTAERLAERDMTEDFARRGITRTTLRIHRCSF